MSRIVFVATVFVLLAGLLFIIPALAGGWAVITLDRLPEGIKVNQAVEIGFMLRGHGVTPVTAEGLSVDARHPESGAELSVPARSEGVEGHYLASLSFPQPGLWEWGIATGPYGFTQPMPALLVQPPGPILDGKGIPPSRFLSATIWPLAGLSIAGAVLLLMRKKHTRLAVSLVAAGLAIAGLGFTLSTAPASGTGAPTGKYDEIEQGSLEKLGSDLFVAKGCVICHQHADISDSLIAFQTKVGPDLSNYTASPAFLRLWLSDPVEIKPKTQMPDLALNEREIESLISFLNKGY